MTPHKQARRATLLTVDLTTRLRADGTYQSLLSEIAGLDDDAYTPGLWEEMADGAAGHPRAGGPRMIRLAVLQPCNRVSASSCTVAG